MRFAHKTAIVAGAGRRGSDAGEGIGSLVAKRLAAEGAAVVVADVNLHAARQVESEIRADGGEAAACEVDVTHDIRVQELVDFARERYGGVDLLHYNPAASGPRGVQADSSGSILELDEGLDVFDHAIDVNVRGFVLCLRAVLPEMLARGGGAIVYTSSGLATQAEPVRGAYSSSKAAGNALCRHAATAFGKRGIRVNAVAPGLTLTHGLTIDNPGVSRQLDHRLTTRLGTPDDQASMILYLLSEDAGYITGQIINVDGGYGAHSPAFADGKYVSAQALTSEPK